MKKALSITISMLLLAAMLVSCTPGGSGGNTNKFTLQYASLGNAYAFSNESGTKLIVFTQISDPNSLSGLNAAIGANGQYLPVAFDKKQNSNSSDTGNYNAYNFNNLEGYLFNVTSGTAKSNTTYLIVKDSLVPQSSLLANTQNGPVVMTHEQKVDMGNAKGRAANQGWILASFADGRQLILAGFEPQGHNYLMSIAIKGKDGKYKFMDYPATSSDPSSVWRVDDQGILDPTLFAILLCADTDKGFTAILNWKGAEGEVTLLLLDDSTVFKDQDIGVSRYWGAY
ncbi:MAG: hypothetical protein GYA50_03270 [Eubacteriaceae bacterium]|nr:hypothetical protein [Eubacteriaceae bacterium]